MIGYRRQETAVNRNIAMGVWLFLMGLSIASYLIGEQSEITQAVVVFLVAAMFLKGQLVAEFFMGLRNAPLVWRSAMAIYLLMVTALVGLAYWISLK